MVHREDVQLGGMGVVCPSGLSEVSTAQASGTTHSTETRNSTPNAAAADGRILRRRRADVPVCRPRLSLIEPFTQRLLAKSLNWNADTAIRTMKNRNDIAAA
jgi:hypothetical protein